MSGPAFRFDSQRATLLDGTASDTTPSAASRELAALHHRRNELLREAGEVEAAAADQARAVALGRDGAAAPAATDGLSRASALRAQAESLRPAIAAATRRLETAAAEEAAAARAALVAQARSKLAARLALSRQAEEQMKALAATLVRMGTLAGELNELRRQCVLRPGALRHPLDAEDAIRRVTTFANAIGLLQWFSAPSFDRDARPADLGEVSAHAACEQIFEMIVNQAAVA